MNVLPYATIEPDTPTSARTFRRHGPGQNRTSAAAAAQTRITRNTDSDKVSARGRHYVVELQLSGRHREIAEHLLEGSHVGLRGKPRRYFDCSTA